MTVFERVHREYKCDACGVTLTQPPLDWALCTILYPPNPVDQLTSPNHLPSAARTSENDLCKPCTNSLQEWFRCRQASSS